MPHTVNIAFHLIKSFMLIRIPWFSRLLFDFTTSVITLVSNNLLMQYKMPCERKLLCYDQCEVQFTKFSRFKLWMANSSECGFGSLSWHFIKPWTLILKGLNKFPMERGTFGKCQLVLESCRGHHSQSTGHPRGLQECNIWLNNCIPEFHFFERARPFVFAVSNCGQMGETVSTVDKNIDLSSRCLFVDLMYLSLLQMYNVTQAKSSGWIINNLGWYKKGVNCYWVGLGMCKGWDTCCPRGSIYIMCSFEEVVSCVSQWQVVLERKRKMKDVWDTLITDAGKIRNRFFCTHIFLKVKSVEGPTAIKKGRFQMHFQVFRPEVFYNIWVRNYLFPKMMLLQREPFLTGCYTINSSPLLVTK